MLQHVITFNYTLKTSEGVELESSVGADPLVFLEGSGQIIPGLERELTKMQIGDKRTIHVPAAEAYGEMDPDLLIEVPAGEITVPNLKVGDELQAQDGEHTQSVVVAKITEHTITLDGNHPMAGRDLVFDVEILNSREATADEIAHGHIHGPQGHHSDHGHIH